MKKILLKNCLIYDDAFHNKILVDIYIDKGKICSIKNSILYDDKDVKVVDVKEKIAIPGIIDCHTHMGIIEEATGKIGIDNNETSNPVTPHLRGIDAINPLDISFGDAISSGITCVMSGPGSNNVVGGQSVAIKTHGMIIDQMVVKNPAGFKVAFGENPLSIYGADSKCPVTRMGTAGLIRELFFMTQDYMVQKEKTSFKGRDIRLEAVIPVLKGEIPLRAHAHRVDDICTAIRIADEFHISNLVIEHGTEAHLIKEYLKEKNVPVAFGPMLTPRIKMELKSRHYSSVLELAEAEVKVALITDHPYNSIDQLRTVAALAVAEGLSTSDALKFLTIHPSEILRCEDKIGKLKVGYDADIAIFDGNPIDIDSKCIMTIINGNIIYVRK